MCVVQLYATLKKRGRCLAWQPPARNRGRSSLLVVPLQPRYGQPSTDKSELVRYIFPTCWSRSSISVQTTIFQPIWDDKSLISPFRWKFFNPWTPNKLCRTANVRYLLHSLPVSSPFHNRHTQQFCEPFSHAGYIFVTRSRVLLQQCLGLLVTKMRISFCFFEWFVEKPVRWNFSSLTDWYMEYANWWNVERQMIHHLRERRGLAPCVGNINSATCANPLLGWKVIIVWRPANYQSDGMLIKEAGRSNFRHFLSRYAFQAWPRSFYIVPDSKEKCFETCRKRKEKLLVLLASCDCELGGFHSFVMRPFCPTR